MRAIELLTAINVNPFDQNHDEICIANERGLIPITGILYNHAEHQLLFVAGSDNLVTMKELLTVLMTHKKYTLLKKSEPIFRFREDKNKIML